MLQSLLIAMSLAATPIYIVRGEPISESEWTSLCAQDDDLEVRTSITITDPESGATISMQTHGSCLYETDDVERPLLFHLNTVGHITTEYSPAALEKFRELAQRLRGRVLGPSGEPL